MDLWVREARLFKYGSGTGTNFSSLRSEGEPLSGGGKSSGPDVLPENRRPRRRRQSSLAAPRAAQPRWFVVDIDHPDIEAYINWKVKEEEKVAAIVTGSKIRFQAPQSHHEGLCQLPRLQR